VVIAIALLIPVLTFVQQHVNAAIGIFAASADIGATREGSTIYVRSSGEYRVTGGGADIWATADDFHFSWVQLSGRVRSLAQRLTKARVRPTVWPITPLSTVGSDG
jgi:hypothetical protein